MYGHDGWGVAGWWGLGLGMLLFWGLVIVGIVLLVRWAAGSRHHTPTVPPSAGPPQVPPVPDRGDALRILEERYARGDIDEEDYLRRRDVLRGG